MQLVQTKAIRYESFYYDGTLDTYTEMKRWVVANGGNLHEKVDDIRGTETIWLFSRNQGTVELKRGQWVVKNAQDDLVIYTPEELNEQYDIL